MLFVLLCFFFYLSPRNMKSRSSFYLLIHFWLKTFFCKFRRGPSESESQPKRSNSSAWDFWVTCYRSQLGRLQETSSRWCHWAWPLGEPSNMLECCHGWPHACFTWDQTLWLQFNWSTALIHWNYQSMIVCQESWIWLNILSNKTKVSHTYSSFHF